MKIMNLLHLAALYVVSAKKIKLQTASYCRIQNDVKPLIDQSLMTDFEGTEACPKRAFVEIDFRAYLYVHYAIVHEKSGAKGQLDYFMASIVSKKVEVPCGIYAAKSGDRQKGMRVNCMFSILRANGFVLHSGRNLGLHVSEIEVYSFAFLPPEENVWLRRGCFSGVDSSLSFEMSGWRHCKKKCSDDGFVFAAIENNKTCHCLKSYDNDHALALKECDLKCANSNHSCGGEGTFSVYAVRVELPKHLGCVPEIKVGIGNMFTNHRMTPTYCLNKCDSNHLFMLKNGDTCICLWIWNTVSYEKAVREVSNCNMKCGGDPESYCGGAEHTSAYRGCSVNAADRTRCSMMFQCYGMIDIDGVCPHGCKNEFIGEHCLEKSQRTSRKFDEMYLIAAAAVLLALLVLFCLMSRANSEEQ